MTREEEIAALEAKIKTRERRPGFISNVAALRERLAQMTGPEVEASPQEPGDDPDGVIDLGTFN